MEQRPALLLFAPEIQHVLQVYMLHHLTTADLGRLACTHSTNRRLVEGAPAYIWQQAVSVEDRLRASHPAMSCHPLSTGAIRAALRVQHNVDHQRYTVRHLTKASVAKANPAGELIAINYGHTLRVKALADGNLVDLAKIARLDLRVLGSCFHWSPCGRQLSFISIRDKVCSSGTWNVDTGAVTAAKLHRRLAAAVTPSVAPPDIHDCLDWSPDAQLAIVYGVLNLHRSLVHRIAILDVLTGRVALAEVHEHSPRWCPDSQAVAFLRVASIIVRHPRTGACLWQYEDHVLNSVSEYVWAGLSNDVLLRTNTKMSPATHKLMFLLCDGGCVDRFLVMTPPDSAVGLLPPPTETIMVDSGSREPWRKVSISSDGTRLAYLQHTSRYTPTASRDTEQKVYVMGCDGAYVSSKVVSRRNRQLADSHQMIFHELGEADGRSWWSPDSSLLVVRDVQKQEDREHWWAHMLSIMHAASGKLWRIQGLPAYTRPHCYTQVQWSSNGSSLFCFAGLRGGLYQVDFS